MAIAYGRRRIILAVLAAVLVLWAWHDGGERPVREIVEPVAVPADLQ